jgi:hypothetical protein
MSKRRRTLGLLGLAASVLLLGLVAAWPARIGFEDENPPWINWFAGPVENQSWGQSTPGGALELQLVPSPLRWWQREPIPHLILLSADPGQSQVQEPFVDNFGRARILGLTPGHYRVARGGGAECVDLESTTVEVRDGQTARVILAH